jgi:hypothetical protein
MSKKWEAVHNRCTGLICGAIKRAAMPKSAAIKQTAQPMSYSSTEKAARRKSNDLSK